jgi:hypothetical protein
MVPRLSAGRGASSSGCLQLIELHHSFVEGMADDAGSSAQRIRIGLTGLAFAFLLVLLGSVISRSRDDGSSPDPQVQANDVEPNEPLAQLGVAPGGAETIDNNSTSNSK